MPVPKSVPLHHSFDESGVIKKILTLIWLIPAMFVLWIVMIPLWWLIYIKYEGRRRDEDRN